MKRIRTDKDVEALRAAGVRPELADLVAAKLADLVRAYRELGDEYEPDVHGEIVVIQPGDDVTNIAEVGLAPEWRGLVGIPKDYVGWHPEADAWEIVACPGNSFAWTYLVGVEVPLPADLADELRGTVAPARIVGLLTAGWDDMAISRLWKDGTAEDFVHVAYLAPCPDGVPDSLLVAKDGDSSVIRDVYEPLFATVAGLANVATGADLSYVADVSWDGLCEFLLLDIHRSDGDWEPTRTVALRIATDPADLRFASLAALEAFVQRNADSAVRQLQQAKGGSDA